MSDILLVEHTSRRIGGAEYRVGTVVRGLSPTGLRIKYWHSQVPADRSAKSGGGYSARGSPLPWRRSLLGCRARRRAPL